MIPTETVNETVRRVRYLSTTLRGIMDRASGELQTRQEERLKL